MDYTKRLLNILKTLIFIIGFVISVSACEQGRQRGAHLCGGSMRSPCPLGHFCDLGNDCGGIDKVGVCRIVPPVCPETIQTVCGCDLKDYQNECIANTLGMTVRHEGTCIEAPKVVNDL